MLVAAKVPAPVAAAPTAVETAAEVRPAAVSAQLLQPTLIPLAPLVLMHALMDKSISSCALQS